MFIAVLKFVLFRFDFLFVCLFVCFTRVFSPWGLLGLVVQSSVKITQG